MALDTYSNLKNAIVNFSGRDDLTSLLDDFIDLAEAEMYFNSTMPLRVRQMEQRELIGAFAGDRFTDLPDGFLDIRALVIIAGGETIELKYVAPAALEIKSTNGRPQTFTITDKIEFDRKPDSAYDIDIQFYGKPTALSAANPKNAILTNYPGVYLNGALSFLYDYAREMQDAEMYYGKFIRSIQGAIKGDKSGRYGPTPAGRVQGVRP